MTRPPLGPLVVSPRPPAGLDLPTGVLSGLGSLPGLEALSGVSPLVVAAAVAGLTAVAVAVGALLGRRRATARIEDGERRFPGDRIECPECGAGNQRGYHYCRECGAELPDSVYDGSVGSSGRGDAGFE